MRFILRFGQPIPSFMAGLEPRDTGEAEAGLTFLGDAGAEFTKAIGMNWTAEPAGFYDRSRRYAMYAEDGVVKVLNVEKGRAPAKSRPARRCWTQI